MSIYSNSSDTYWKERQQTNKNKLLGSSKTSLLFIASIVIFAVVAAILHNRHSNNNNNSNQMLTQRRSIDQTTEVHWKQCEAKVNSKQECTTICQPERISIHRKTMHQACLHGCQQAHATSTTLSCRGKVSSEEEVFQEIGGMSYIHCSKFQSTDPKPDVFATCRKYHRAGTKAGFRMGTETMNNILNEEWVSVLEGLSSRGAGAGTEEQEQ